MAYVDIPLSCFTGSGGQELIEQLYAVPDKNAEVQKRPDDYEVIQNLPTISGYNPTRGHKPSTIWDNELEPIFGTSNICIFSQEYKVFENLKHQIMCVVDKSSHIAFTVKNTDFVAFPDSINEFMVQLFQYNDFSWNDFVIWDDEKESDMIMDWRDREITEKKLQIEESSEV